MCMLKSYKTWNSWNPFLLLVFYGLEQYVSAQDWLEIKIWIEILVEGHTVEAEHELHPSIQIIYLLSIYIEELTAAHTELFFFFTCVFV